MQKPLNKLLNYGDVSCSSNIWVCGLLKCKYSKETWWFAPTFKWWYLLCVLCKQLLVFNLQMKFHGCMSMHMEPLHLFFHVILYTKTNRVLLITHKALTSEPVEDFPWFDQQQQKTYSTVLSHVSIHYTTGSNFWAHGQNLMVWPCKVNLFSLILQGTIWFFTLTRVKGLRRI